MSWQMQVVFGFLVAGAIGAIVGWLFSLRSPNRKLGGAAHMLVGIAGSLVGLWSGPMMTFLPATYATALGLAIAGAVLFILVFKVLGVLR